MTDLRAKGSTIWTAWQEQFLTWLHDTFPERQIYIRSDGRVQFFTFGPTLQATLAGLTLLFLMWVAFSTVNVVFKDHIIAAKDYRYRQMQAAYENRVADLQLSYDELNGAMVAAQDRFKATADEVQLKQNSIVRFLDHKRQVDALVSGAANSGVADVPPLAAASKGAKNWASAGDDLGASAPSSSYSLSNSDDPSAGSTITIMPQPVPAQPRTAKPTHASLLDLGSTVGTLAGAVFGHKVAPPIQTASNSKILYPALKGVAEQISRLQKIGKYETALMTSTRDEIASGVSNIRSVMNNAGLDPERFTGQYESERGLGGPDIPIHSVQIQGLSDPAFRDAYFSASAELNQMDQLLGALRHVPLTTPVSGSEFEQTSGFGARVDPFTGHYSFHPGIDFAGPWGSTVHATAPGIVVVAESHGAYGNMVEIDHGLGIHTRYGHLSSILVRAGARVPAGAPIGKLGSTGRSTGPHVHYEIWYDNLLRNPSRFIGAGHHVL